MKIRFRRWFQLAGGEDTITDCLSRLDKLTRPQCVYCIEVHTKAAKKAGATREQVAEAVLLAAALRAGGAAAHGALALKIYEQAGS